MKDTYIKQLLSFIQESPTAFHVVANVEKILTEHGFFKLQESDPWKIEPGRKYYTLRNDASLIAFTMPDMTDAKSYRGFHIAAAHSDSPAFVLKDHCEMKTMDSYIRLNTEKYGGMILSTWLDRPLSIAGRVVVSDSVNGTMETKLIHIDRDLLVIPSLAIHMDRKMNQGYEYNPQVDMLPIYSEIQNAQALEELIATEAGVHPSEIISQELFLYVRQEGTCIGAVKEWIMAPRLDDQECVYGLLKGFCDSLPQNYINVLAVFHNEEVGSQTRQGADSTFLEDVLLWISESLGESMGQYRKKCTQSFLLSADNAHAVHPNHPEKADPTNQPKMNGGVVLKFHGGQKYTTDALTAANVKRLCKQSGIPYQTYHNRSDILGGSTLGNISTSHVSIPSADIGLAQLAMHSAIETAGTKDIEYLIQLVKNYFSE